MNHWLNARKQRQSRAVFYFELIGEVPECLVQLCREEFHGVTTLKVETGAAEFVLFADDLIKNRMTKRVEADAIIKVCDGSKGLVERWVLPDALARFFGVGHYPKYDLGIVRFTSPFLSTINSRYF